ncbi:hypothetical protein Dsin_028674 [Dipteronia sinensis]|uniref:Reverse transcriptase domain-containing protein n=1 Tax=Dipteronia sinensis TaxID=43782 RepID=A0AAE0DUH3_9ROSI|nr:hypothetical protein Dsin_028674 [Dipteronia sinensis]
MSNIQERLARVLVDRRRMDHFLQVKVDHLGFNSSDHRPILLNFDSVRLVQLGRAKGFQFEHYWLKDEDIGQVVEVVGMRKGPTYSVKGLKSKLNWCAVKLLGWSTDNFGLSQKLIDEKQKQVELLYLKCGEKFWSTVGSEVTQVYLQVLNGGISIREFNVINVVLIPKIHEHHSLLDFRLISLCSVVYKTVTKVLANRLKTCLPAIISFSQSTFVPSHLIFDNVLVSFETLQSIARCKAEKKGLMALKLDMSKAYDKVEWTFSLSNYGKNDLPLYCPGYELYLIFKARFFC